jgi:hypothetical protein
MEGSGGRRQQQKGRRPEKRLMPVHVSGLLFILLHTGGLKLLSCPNLAVGVMLAPVGTAMYYRTCVLMLWIGRLMRAIMATA